MTKIEINRFFTDLKQKADELVDANGIRATLAIETSADELDRIQGGQERDMAIGTFDRNSKLLREVRAALSRVEADTFGTCLGCEEAISQKRLAAVPWAAFCIRCQEAADSEARQVGSVPEELLVDAA
jgi:DnaK suppressor protein